MWKNIKYNLFLLLNKLTVKHNILSKQNLHLCKKISRISKTKYLFMNLGATWEKTGNMAKYCAKSYSHINM